MIAGLFTGALLLLFIGGWIWAWSPQRKQAFDEAAQLPLDENAQWDRVRDGKEGVA
jgi:cytochrome c oxidase cbb3-type subunit IV